MRLPSYLVAFAAGLLVAAASCQESESVSSAATAAKAVNASADQPAKPEATASAPAKADPTEEKPAPPPATQPVAAATPIEDIPLDTVLVKLGDARNITQGDFEKAAAGFHPTAYANLLEQLIRDNLLLLYIKDHPHLVTDEDVEKQINRSLKRNQTREQYEKEMEKRGLPINILRDRARLALLDAALRREADQKVENESFRNQLYHENPYSFDGSEVFVRLVVLSVPAATPASEREARRKKIEDIRQRLVTGQIDWKTALDECGNPSLAAANGEIGWKSRMGIEEPLAKVAFEINPGDISPVIEARGGYAFLQVRERRKGDRPPDDRQTIQQMKVWLEAKTIQDAYEESLKKYAPARLRPPARTPLMASKELPAPPRPSTPAPGST